MDKGFPEFINEKGELTSTGINFQSTDPAYLKYEGSVDPTVTGGFDKPILSIKLGRWDCISLSRPAISCAWIRTSQLHTVITVPCRRI